MHPEVLIRDARDSDAAARIALIGGAFAEYEGCVLDVDNELPELRAIATAFRSFGGRFWVGELHGAVVASIGYSVPSESDREPSCRLCNVARSRRASVGTGLRARCVTLSKPKRCGSSGRPSSYGATRGFTMLTACTSAADT